jgi:hypothetical protein
VPDTAQRLRSRLRLLVLAGGLAMSSVALAQKSPADSAGKTPQEK